MDKRKKIIARCFAGLWIAGVLTAWFHAFFPWFYITEQESFFCFLPSFHASVLLAPGGLGEWTARFFSQFFLFDLSTVLVCLLLLAGCIWAGGAPAAVVFFCFAWSGLWGLTLTCSFFIALCLARLSNFLYPRLKPLWYWVLNIGLMFLAFIGCGWLCLFFVWFTAFQPKRFKPRALLLLVLLPLCAWVADRWLCMPFSQAVGYDGFLQAGKVQTAALLAVLALRALPPASTVLAGLCWLMWAAVVWFNPAYTVQKTFYQTERAADRQNWSEVYKLASDYFLNRHPYADETHKRPEFYRDDKHPFYYRDLLAVNLKTALMETRRLNNEFFKFHRSTEMCDMFSNINCEAGRYNIPNIRAAWCAGLMMPMRIYANNHLNTHDITFANLKYIIPNSIFQGRYALAGNYLYYQSHTLFYKKRARYWAAFNSAEKSNDECFIARHRQTGNKQMQEEDIVLKFWACAVYTPQSDIKLLDFKTLADLQDRRLEALPEDAQHYLQLGYKVLPRYVQEGLLLLYNFEYGNRMPDNEYTAMFDHASILEYLEARELCKNYAAGQISFEELEKHSGDGYYLYYFMKNLHSYGL